MASTSTASTFDGLVKDVLDEYEPQDFEAEGFFADIDPFPLTDITNAAGGQAEEAVAESGGDENGQPAAPLRTFHLTAGEVITVTYKLSNSTSILATAKRGCSFEGLDASQVQLSNNDITSLVWRKPAAVKVCRSISTWSLDRNRVCVSDSERVTVALNKIKNKMVSRFGERIRPYMESWAASDKAQSHNGYRCPFPGCRGSIKLTSGASFTLHMKCNHNGVDCGMAFPESYELP